MEFFTLAFIAKGDTSAYYLFKVYIFNFRNKKLETTTNQTSIVLKSSYSKDQNNPYFF